MTFVRKQKKGKNLPLVICFKGKVDNNLKFEKIYRKKNSNFIY